VRALFSASARSRNAAFPRCSRSSELIAVERPRGVFSRQLILGDNLDLVPAAERAKPRKISVESTDSQRTIEG
jgi:HSP20 family protein